MRTELQLARHRVKSQKYRKRSGSLERTANSSLQSNLSIRKRNVWYLWRWADRLASWLAVEGAGREPTGKSRKQWLRNGSRWVPSVGEQERPCVNVYLLTSGCYVPM